MQNVASHVGQQSLAVPRCQSTAASGAIHFQAQSTFFVCFNVLFHKRFDYIFFVTKCDVMREDVESQCVKNRRLLRPQGEVRQLEFKFSKDTFKLQIIIRSE